ncbi:MAG: hypothetical protein U0401_33445 [Anaerolineae bacterium]
MQNGLGNLEKAGRGRSVHQRAALGMPLKGQPCAPGQLYHAGQGQTHLAKIPTALRGNTKLEKTTALFQYRRLGNYPG